MIKQLALIAIGCALAIPSLRAQNAPNFSLPNFETGATVNLNDFEDQVIVLKFFAYW